MTGVTTRTTEGALVQPRPPKRRIDGVLLLDKPVGASSNQALQQARRLFRAEKAGHTGTLDPFASGLLPLCFGEATKFSRFLLDADKVYVAEVRLGVRTTTGDPEGEILRVRHAAVAERQVEDALAGFVGSIRQVPPMHSALKRDGRPLYDYARRGIEVERPARDVVVHAIDLLAIEGERVYVRVHCGKGFYVRSFADDLGETLGCGGHLAALRRELVGPFRVEDAHGLDDLEAQTMEARDALLLPPDCLLGDLRRLDLDPESAWQIRHGQAVWRSGLRVGEALRVYAPDGALLGVAEVNLDGLVAPIRLLAGGEAGS